MNVSLSNHESTTRYLVDATCNIIRHLTAAWAWIVQWVQRLAIGWTVWGSNPNEDENFRTRPYRPWSPPSFLYNIYRAIPGEKCPGRSVDHPPHLTPRIIKEHSCTSISLLDLRDLS